ncbi:unnamed protein product [Ectocarpus sp. 8 AP-2014]
MYLMFLGSHGKYAIEVIGTLCCKGFVSPWLVRPVIKEYSTQGILLRTNEEISQPTGFWTGRRQEKAPELTGRLMSRSRGASQERVGFARGRGLYTVGSAELWRHRGREGAYLKDSYSTSGNCKAYVRLFVSLQSNSRNTPSRPSRSRAASDALHALLFASEA